MTTRAPHLTTCLLLVSALLLPIQNALAEQSRRDPAPESLFTKNVLSDEDQELYTAIFDWQDRGAMRTADKLIAQVSDPVLMGHVLYQRYMHPTAYRSSYEDLYTWMQSYADHPGAKAIHKLAKRRRVPGYGALIAPRVRLYQGGRVERTYTAPRTPKPRSANGKKLWNRVISLIKRGGPTAAERHLREKSSGRLLGARGFDYLAWRVARSHFVNGNTQQAFDLARLAAKRSADQVPLADWIAGLASWKLLDYKTAMEHFQRLAASSTAPPWARAGAAFWAARGSLRFGDPADVWRFARLGAEQPTSFYSILCRALLGIRIADADGAPALAETAALKLVWDSDRIRRARAASEVGRDDIASKEVRAAYAEMPSGNRSALLALIAYMNVPEFALQLGGSVDSVGLSGRFALQYPVAGWQPDDGYQIDRALIFALIRQESRFKPNAKSPAGARGLMQIMPSTASYVSGDRQLRSRKRYRLYQPSFNISLGQRYVQYLMDTKYIGPNLLYFTAAYNGGPGNLQKWQRAGLVDDKDPLLFVETIPHVETRNYVKIILANFWMYRYRLGQEAPSLNAMAQGRWPEYSSLDRSQPPQLLFQPQL